MYCFSFYLFKFQILNFLWKGTHLFFWSSKAPPIELKYLTISWKCGHTFCGKFHYSEDLYCGKRVKILDFRSIDMFISWKCGITGFLQNWKIIIRSREIILRCWDLRAKSEDFSVNLYTTIQKIQILKWWHDIFNGKK